MVLKSILPNTFGSSISGASIFTTSVLAGSSVLGAGCSFGSSATGSGSGCFTSSTFGSSLAIGFLSSSFLLIEISSSSFFFLASLLPLGIST